MSLRFQQIITGADGPIAVGGRRGKHGHRRGRGLRVIRAVALLAVVLLTAPALFAQSPSEVLYREDFQSSGTQQNPPGWVDTAIGKPGPVAEGLYKTWPDPTQGNKAPNIVYGTKSASGKPEGRNPRIGTFSTLTTKTFDSKGRFEFSGRLIRTRDDGRVGVTFLSQYPTADKYYLLGLWSQPASSKLTMQIFAFDKTLEDPANPLGDQSARLEGTKDSGVTLDANKWYRFFIRTDDRDGKTRIQAKVWLDGTAEPAAFQIDATDAAAQRLTAGHIGLWSAVKGENYIDEILAKSPVDFTAPQIKFFYATTSGEAELPNGYQTNQNLTPIIRVTDDIDPNPDFTVTLDDQPFNVGSTVSAEGTHTLRVRATDSVGNDAENQVSFFIDKTRPTVRVLEGTLPLEEGQMFGRDVSINLEIEDASSTTVTATLDGASFTPGTPLVPAPLYGVEKHTHELVVEVRDVVGNVTLLPAIHFTIDKTDPTVSILKDGGAFSGGAFNTNVTLTSEYQDLTPTVVTMLLNGQPYTAGTVIASDGDYTITATATDALGHATTAGPIAFVINKSGPAIRFLDGGAPLQAGAIFNRDVPAKIEVINSLVPNVTAKLDGADWPLTLETTVGNTRTYAGSVVTTEGLRNLEVRVTDAAGNDVQPSIQFTIDKTQPTIEIRESGVAFPHDKVFDRDAVATVDAHDAITSVSTTMALDNEPYIEGTPISAEGTHAIEATAVDEAENSRKDGPINFTIDKSLPVVSLLERDTAFPADFWFNRDVEPKLEIKDLTAVTVSATIDGVVALFTRSSVNGETSIWTVPIVTTEGLHTIVVAVTDVVGHVTPLDPVSFTIDKTRPAITVSSHTAGQVVTSPVVTLSGASDDAITVTVNGGAATVDLNAKTWTSAEQSLLEGSTTFIVVGTDRAGNSSEVTHALSLDTRGPALAVTSPANGSCLNVAALTITGTASDERLTSVKARVGAATIDAVLSNGSWTVTIPNVAEGPLGVVIEAADASGHTTSANLSYRIDRTAPNIEITEAGAPFAAALVNRSVALFVRSSDTDLSVALTLKLDTLPYVSGTVIESEDTHTLEVSARDCAGLTATRTITFRIDKTPPVLSSFSPANGSTVGTMPGSITGTTNEKATIAIVGSGATVSAPAGPFALPNVSFEEGTNRFTLRATDDAGNASELAYLVTVKTSAPSVEILESGAPLAPNTLFNRDVKPEIRSNDREATITATLNGTLYTSGTAITTDGTYTLAATASDSLEHTGSHSVTFRIDKTPPAVAITAPAAGSSVSAETVTVTGTSGDATSVTVNGAAATIAAGGFSAALPLELGENLIVAVGHDDAGNSGRDEVTVTRAGAGPAIVLLYPTDKSLTNRPKTEVRGRVITPANVASVTFALGGETKATLTPDAAGDFRTTLDLIEGLNTIRATSLGKDGKSATAAVQVTADFTPPALKILANGAELREGARFASEARLTLEVSDAQTSSPIADLTVDGAAAIAPTNITEDGGHVALATARDAAGNEARVERSFTIGSGTGTSAGCSVTQLDPKADSIISSTATRIAGRTSAPGVKVAGVPAEVVDGSFCVSVELPNEGENTITIVCTDASGATIGSPVTHTLKRVTGAPVVTITSPSEGETLAKTDTGMVSVSGTAGPGVVALTVNGVRKALDTNIDTLRNFTVEGVRLAAGLNIVAARAETSSLRTATATRRVVYAADPATISITSPVGTVITGATTIDVSGTWSNLDPSSLIPAVSTIALGDTAGSFILPSVPLNIGPNRITISGIDAAGQPVSALVEVTRTAGVPSVSITEPSDNTYVTGDSVMVRGTAEAAEGSTVQVSGVAADTTSESLGEGRVRITFSAPATVSASSAITPIVARVLEPAGGGAFDTIRVTRFADAFAIEKDDDEPKAELVFPAANAVQVPTTIQTLVAFTHPVDKASVMAGGIALVASNGQPVSGVTRVDRDVVSFAPSVPLAEGEAFTIKVAATVKDLAGAVLGTAYQSSFVTAITAPQTAPQVSAVPAAVCGTTLGIDGVALPNARVQLDSGSWQFSAQASAAGAFHFDLPLSGQSGYQLVRVRTVGTDGSLSPSADVCVRVDCGGTRVLNAAYDSAANAITVLFSGAIDGSSLGVGSSMTLTGATGTAIGGSVVLTAPATAVVTPERNLAEETFTLGVTTAVKDANGNALTAPFSQTFFAGGGSATGNPGDGYLTGEVYDATTGRPLAGATVALVGPASSPAFSDSRGRYTIFVPEGAHTIEVSAPNYTTVWRQIIVPAGTGVVPIDVRLERRGETKPVASGELTLTDGSATELTKPVSLTVASGSLTSGSSVTLTSVNAQSLAGLLPLGWSPLASAEVVVTSSVSGRAFQARPSEHAMFGHTPVTGTIEFTVDATAITNATQTLTAVRYDATRDEWTVVSIAVTITGSVATVNISRDGAYALVYPDKGSGLVTPSVPSAGTALQGVTDPCVTADTCGPLTKQTFTLNPRVVMPEQRTTATLEADSVLSTQYAALPPSGTAVQAYIDEELTLADGSTITDPPFATDLILYRELDGAPAAATFHLAPSKRATEVFLQVGWEHIRIHAYPGRLDRGTLIGNEGGRVPGDGSVTVDIPAGATPEPVHATVSTLPASELPEANSISGYTVLGGFELTLDRVAQATSQDLDGDGNPDAIGDVQLFKSADATFAVDASAVTQSSQVILAEVVNQPTGGTLFRLASLCGAPAAGDGTTARVSTLPREGLPVEGIVREGRYLFLAAKQPIAYATGVLRSGTAVLSGALMTSSATDASGTLTLGTEDLTNATGLFSLPVLSAPRQPFQLSMRHTSLGVGTGYTHPGLPAKDEVVSLGFVGFEQKALTMGASSLLVIENGQPKEVPAPGAREVALTTFVKVAFSEPVDDASAKASFALVDSSTGAVVPGTSTASANTVTWNITPGERLKPNSRYVLTVAPTLRSTSGVAFGQSRSITFSTVSQLLGGGVRADKISITIPDANGISTIKGIGSTDPAQRAVPSNAQVVPVRRGRSFVTIYQATADINGAFEFQIGTAGGADRVSISDVIDLQVISGNMVIAVIRLTPFVTADGKGFVAPPDLDTRFTSADGVSVVVPMGAFDVPTLVAVAPESSQAFAAVPDFASEVTSGGAIKLDFEGVAKKRIQVELPLGSADPSKTYHLGVLGDSIRGPRVMIVDTLRVDGSKLTTAAASSSARTSRANAAALPASPETATDVKSALLGVLRRGTYTWVDLQGPTGSSVGWAAISGIQSNLDLFWDKYHSLYASSFYIAEKRGSVVIPIPQNTSFEVVGVDASTGLEAFAKAYAPLLPGDPGSAVPVPTPGGDLTGPYPVFGTPFRVEIVDLPEYETSLTDIRNFFVKFKNGLVTVLDDPDTKLPDEIPVTLFNVTQGAIDAKRIDGLVVPATFKDRVVILIGVTEIDPDTSLSIVFSEPIALPDAADADLDNAIDAYLKTIFHLEEWTETSLKDITSYARFSTDSSARRVLVDLPASLERGVKHRFTISSELTDQTGVKIGQVVKDGEPAGTLNAPNGELELYFTVRKPAGQLSSFDITSGTIRDLALNDNVLLVSAMEGGVFAFDVSNPAGMTSATKPFGQITTPNDGDPLSTRDTHCWAVASDHHDRIYRTVLGPEFGALQSFRLESMLPMSATGDTKVVTTPVGGAIVSIAPGYSSSLPLTSGPLLSDRAEAIPRKLQILLQDDDETFPDLATLLEKYPATTQNEGDFKRLTLRIPRTATHEYRTQRITLENVTAGLRWSADASSTEDALLADILVRTNDRVRIIRNVRTYGVVSLFGYGVGLYDLNAIESNDAPEGTSNVPVRPEQIRLTNAALHPTTCLGQPEINGSVISDLTLNPESGILTEPGSSQLLVYGLDPMHGMVDLTIDPSQAKADECTERVSGGLVFRGTGYDHPRLAELRNRFFEVAGRYPNARFNSLAFYRWRLEAADNKAIRGPEKPGETPLPGQRGSVAGQRITRDYFLVPGNEYGLLIVEASGDTPLADGAAFRPLREQNLVDIVWIPSGAFAVRMIPRTNLAAVVDREGRVLLVDLSRIDERFDAKGERRPDAELFPTVSSVLDKFGAYGVGSEDPRIVWKSATGVVNGALAPVVDPETGMIYAGKLLKTKVDVVAATDPRIQIKADLGDPNGLSEVSGIVPLGLELPKALNDKIKAAPADRQKNASLGAFRFEVTLPGAITESLGGSLTVDVKNETVQGALAGPMGSMLPASEKIITLQRVVPNKPELISKLRHQRGFNRFVSPWIVAIADPRASEQYDWKDADTAAKKEAEGCFNCERPESLRGRADSEVPEIFSNGRILAVSPRAVDGTPYAYLGSAGRLTTRFATVPADTVRTPEVLSAAQNPAIAGGALMSSLYVHSGEISTSAIDLDAGGRAGWNVVIDRTYRSRSILGSPFGMGWDSSIFRRLRPLPNGDVEYRDASGEIWRFVNTPALFGAAVKGVDTYLAPRGLFLRLSRTDRGWMLTDQKWRMTHFDAMGRITMESDEFRAARVAATGGNAVQYLYDARGRLAQIIDPVGRETVLQYYESTESEAKAGLVKSVMDWRNRLIEYDYDDKRRLTVVRLPDVANTDGVRPIINYSYSEISDTYSNRLEMESNLASITDPGESSPRVSYIYIADAPRDRVFTEKWVTGETPAVLFPGENQATVTDALGQKRTYETTAAATSYNGDRPHVKTLVESAIPTSTQGFASLPSVVVSSAPATAAQDRKFVAEYQDGLLRTATLEGVRKTIYTWKSVEPMSPGFVLAESETMPVGSPGMYAGSAIKQTVSYQGGAYGAALLRGVKSGTDFIDMPEPSSAFEGATPLTSTNDSVESTTFRENGLPTTIRSKGGTDFTPGADIKINYGGVTGSIFERGLPKKIDSGDLSATLSYAADKIVKTNPRGIATTTKLDTWQRPTQTTVSGDAVPVDVTSAYDVKGRLRTTTRRQGSDTITTTYEYDRLGRTTKITTDNVAVAGTKKEVSTTIVYDVGGKKITTTAPSGAVTTTELDALGRTVKSSTTTSATGDPIESHVAYDIDDNLVYATDLFTANATAYDVHGRAVAERLADGTASYTTYDDWNRPKDFERRSADGEIIGQTSIDMTAAGSVQAVRTKIDNQTISTTRRAWDGAGRTTRVTTGTRAAASRFSASGKLLSSEVGEGTVDGGVTDAFSSTTTDIAAYTGALPTTVHSGEKGGNYQLGLGYDNVGNVTSQTLGNLKSGWTYNAAGDLITATQPNRPEAKFDYDARGALTTETKPDGAAVQYAYDALGAPASYTDETDEATETKTDLIGRPTLRTYADSTNEQWTYDGPRLESYKDRQGRLRQFEYNSDKGQLTRILGSGNELLEKIEYDLAGRVIRRSNKDVAIEYDDFNLAGQPRLTRQIRYKDESGLGGFIVLDQYEQTHSYNEHAERSGWTMPSYTGMTIAAGWTKSLSLTRDAMGNLSGINRTLWGSSEASPLLSGAFRNAGRPDQRTLTTNCSAVGTTCAPVSIMRTYGYDTSTGQMNAMRVSTGGSEVAGSIVTYDGLQRATATLVGLSAGLRVNEWHYDDRGRLESFGQATDVLTPADFRTDLQRPEGATLPSITFTEKPGGGHKVDTVTKGTTTNQLAWDGSEMVDDGTFVYDFDTYGRLVKVTEKVTGGPSSLSVRRIHYTYSPANRMVGRRAEYAVLAGPTTPPLETDWKLEDRGDIIADDALPAEATFVWDPFADTIVSVFKTGASGTINDFDPNGGLVRQIIHGGFTYDDPIEVTIVDPNVASTGNVALSRLYPIYDEAGAGSLQAVMNAAGEMVARTGAGGAYGEDEYALPGPAVEKIAIQAAKNDAGSLTQVSITMRLTERIDAATLATGVRLTAHDASGALVRSSSAAPKLFDANTAGWTLTAEEWATLTAGPASRLSIAATDQLRAAGWSDVPVLTLPTWMTEAQPVFSSSQTPVEARESVAAVGAWIDGIEAGKETSSTLFEVTDLAALGSGLETASDPSRLLIAAPFHAHPFFEPLTQKNYVRNRWFDPGTGTWLTPDPLGYQDSSNLYAFCGGDPINERDPLGLGEGHLGGLLTDTWGLNPDVPGYVEREIGGWISDKVNSISDAKVKAYVKELRDLPTTVVAAAYTRANPVVATVAATTGFVNCTVSSVSARQESGGLLLPLQAMEDCLGYDKLMTAVSGRDLYSGAKVSPEQQAQAEAEVFGALTQAMVFGALNKPAAPTPVVPRAPNDRGYVSGFRQIREKYEAAKSGDITAMGEIQAAKALRSEGTNVHFQTPTGARGATTADFLVGGERGTGMGGLVFDVYTPKSTNFMSVYSTVAGKNDQAPNIIVNLLNNPYVKRSSLGSEEYMLEQVRLLIEPAGGTMNIKSIRVLGGD